MLALPVRRFFALFLLAAAFAFVSATVQADDSVYQVNGVGVDITAGNETEAKAKGIARAKRLAFDRLLERLTLSETRASIPAIDYNSLEQMIYGVSIASEKMSRGQGRYLARINVSFLPDAVRQWLQANSISYAETKSKKLVILPVLQEQGQNRLWTDGNTWLRAWGHMVLETGLLPVVLPLGDLSDIATISAAQALEGDEERMKAIAAKYGADGVLLTIAKPRSDGAGELAGLTATSRVYAAGWSGSSYSHTVDRQEGQEPIAVMSNAAARVLHSVEDDWKHRNLIDYSGDRQKMVVTAPLQSLNDWVNLRGVLDRLALVDTYVVETLSTTKAIIALDYLGSTEQLQTALAQADLTLRYDDIDQRWVLSRR